MARTHHSRKPRAERQDPVVQSDREVQYMVALCKHIRKGRLDAHLDTILQTIKKRQVTLQDERAVNNAAMLQPGDEVRITNIKPKYLEGLRGYVLDKDELDGLVPPGAEKKMAIPINLRAGRVRKYGPRIWVPASCLIKIGAE